MNICCNLPDNIKKLIESEDEPRDIRSQFEVTGSERGLVINRDVNFTLAGYWKIEKKTNVPYLEPKPWDTITLSFAEDADIGTPVLSEATFGVIDKGDFNPDFNPDFEGPDIDSMERWQGTVLASALNVLAQYEWVVAQLKGDDNTLISRCVFEVLGGQ